MPRPPTLVWVPKGLDPLPSLFEAAPAAAAGLQLSIFNHIADAVGEALAQRAERAAEGLLPWICVGTGEGTAVFNIQGILVMRMAHAEGVADAAQA